VGVIAVVAALAAGSSAHAQGARLSLANHRLRDFAYVQIQFGRRQEARRACLRVVTVIRAKTCCAKTMIGEKGASSSVPSNACRGEFGPC
jgi:hypothetical protein